MRHCFALDLKDNPALIAEYERIHQAIWPDIHAKILAQGITVMDIYRVGNRMFMIMETDDTYNPDAKAAEDATDPLIQRWEAFMDTFQQRLPFAEPGQKWVQMKQIFRL